MNAEFFHGTRYADLTHLRPSTGGEFGPGIYLTNFEPTAQMYAQHVARGPDAPTVLIVHVSLRNPFKVTKSDWVKMTERSTPSTVQRRLRAKGYDSILGVANNGYESQLIVFDPENVHVESRRSVQRSANRQGSREPWHLPPEKLRQYEGAVEEARRITRAARETAARRAHALSPEARQERIAFYEARLRELGTSRSRIANSIRTELRHFIASERHGVNTSEWTPPAMPTISAPRRRKAG